MYIVYCIPLFLIEDMVWVITQRDILKLCTVKLNKNVNYAASGTVRFIFFFYSLSFFFIDLIRSRKFVSFLLNYSFSFIHFHSFSVSFVSFSQFHAVSVSFSQFQSVSVSFSQFQSVSVSSSQFQSVSVSFSQFQSFSVIFSHFQSFSVSFSQFQSVSVSF